jgi:hypothetical protein
MRYFLDTEFNGLGGDLISLALVREDGHEIYAALPCDEPVQWVAENVIPIVTCPGASPRTVRKLPIIGLMIAEFLLNDHRPVIIADWPDDIGYFCDTLITGPGQMVNIPTLSFMMWRVDAYPTDLSGAIQHNALWDARALRRKITG